MDLKHDWKIFNEVLFPNDVVGCATPTLVLIEEDGKVLDGVVSTGAIFSDQGFEGVNQEEKREALTQKYSAEKTVFISKNELDLMIPEISALGTNYFHQLQALRSRVMGVEEKPTGLSQVFKRIKPLEITRDHFVLSFFGKSLKKVLPSRFNVLVFISDEKAPSSILLSFNKGLLDQFFEPDFSSLHELRLSQWSKDYEAIGQYLENRYMLPCYALFMEKSVWQACLLAESQKTDAPWDLFAEAHREGRAAVYPEGFLSKGLLLTQKIRSYFK